MHSGWIWALANILVNGMDFRFMIDTEMNFALLFGGERKNENSEAGFHLSVHYIAR